MPTAPGRSGAQAPLAAVPPGVEGAAVAPGHGGELRDRVSEDVMGVEDLDVVGPHAGAAQVDEDPGQLLEVGLGAGRLLRGLLGVERDRTPSKVLGAEELAPQAAADGREEVEDGVGAVLTGPFLQDEPCRRQQLPEELLSVLPFPALAPAQLARHRDEAREQGLHEHPADEGVGVRLPEQDPHQAGGLLALGAARGPPHVLDDVARGRARSRTVLPVPRTRAGQARIAPGHGPERPDGAGRAADGPPLGGHLVDEGDAVFRLCGGHGATVAVGPPPIPPPGPERGCVAQGAAIPQVGDSVRPMDIDEFYEADPRRRASAELELGTEWVDKDGVRHELNYVEDTGELYVLREPAPHVTEDPFGGLHV